jgi:NAD(P)-dependent dehydrogenase (short-subunit alcohol dehydrogenase family)
VAIVDIQAQAGAELVSQIEAQGGKAVFVEADVSKASAVDAAVRQALSTLGSIQILVNHAGTVIVKSFIETTEEDWDRLMAINVKSMFLMSRAVLRHMLEAGGGIIVNTGSVSGMTASPLESVYCVSKGAVHQLTRSIAVEYRDRGIRCNAVAPGFIRTPHGLRETSGTHVRTGGNCQRRSLSGKR